LFLICLDPLGLGGNVAALFVVLWFWLGDGFRLSGGPIPIGWRRLAHFGPVGLVGS
jgi:hypothetical protein